MKIKNYTPHAVVLCGKEYPSEGIARVSVSEVETFTPESSNISSTGRISFLRKVLCSISDSFLFSPAVSIKRSQHDGCYWVSGSSALLAFCCLNENAFGRSFSEVK